MKHFKHVEIISQHSEATKRNAMYIIPIDAEFCEVIFVDSNGNKRRLKGGGGGVDPVGEWSFELTDDMELIMSGKGESDLAFTVNDQMELIQTGGEEFDFEIVNGDLLLNN